MSDATVALEVGLNAAKLAFSGTPIGRFIGPVYDIVSSLLDEQIRFGVEFVTGEGASLARETGEVLIGLADAEVYGGDTGNVLIGLDRALVDGRGGDDWLVHLGSGEVRGGDGDDWILGIGSQDEGPEDRLELHGEDAHDVIAFILGQGGIAHGGSGNDFLHGGGAESHLWGDEGADVFHIGSNTFIEDAGIGTGDNVMMYGVPLYGGAKQWWMEGNTAYWAPFTTVMSGFPVPGSTILMAASFFIDQVTMKFASYGKSADGYLVVDIGWGLGGKANLNDYNVDLDSGLGAGGITVFHAELADPREVTFERINNFANLARYAGFGHGRPGYDSLVLDLDGANDNESIGQRGTTYNLRPERDVAREKMCFRAVSLLTGDEIRRKISA